MGLYNFLNDFLSEDKTIICVSNVKPGGVDVTYEQSKFVLTRNHKALMLDGEDIKI